jgi:hypothetical protein
MLRRKRCKNAAMKVEAFSCEKKAIEQKTGIV